MAGKIITSVFPVKQGLHHTYVLRAVEGNHEGFSSTGQALDLLFKNH
jgi:hypothetical protein